MSHAESATSVSAAVSNSSSALGRPPEATSPFPADPSSVPTHNQVPKIKRRPSNLCYSCRPHSESDSNETASTQSASTGKTRTHRLENKPNSSTSMTGLAEQSCSYDLSSHSTQHRSLLSRRGSRKGEPRAGLATSAVLWVFYCKKIVDLSEGQIKDPLSGRILLSFVPPRNSLVSVLDP